jgi:hypothetical protein
MKYATLTKSLVLSAALILASMILASTVLASSAFASTKATLEITNPVMVNGTTLKPGDYKVEWDGAGPNVEVSILQGKKVLAKVQGQLVELPAPSPSNAAIVRENGSGPKTLAGVRFGGKKLSLELSETGENMQGGSSK